MDPNRKNLADHMAARREALRLSWREVARLAGMTEQNLLRIRQGDITVTDQAATGIDHALKWRDGVRAALNGDTPTPEETEVRRTSGEVPRVVTMTADELAARFVDIWKDLGDDEAKRFLAAAIKLREEMLTGDDDSPSTGTVRDRAG